MDWIGYEGVQLLPGMSDALLPVQHGYVLASTCSALLHWFALVCLFMWVSASSSSPRWQRPSQDNLD